MSNSDQFQLDLDSPENTPPYPVLPKDGETTYHGVIFPIEAADSHLQTLLTSIPWQHDETVIFGKRIITARQMAWYGDRDFDYRYSGNTHTAKIWTPDLLTIKNAVEEASGSRYNSCLLNLYADGDQGMGWHSDDEKELNPDANIASVSFGAERRFDFRHKQSREKASVFLEHGSLLIMAGATQTHWHHQIPKTKKVTTPRVNLTFRQIATGEK
ncbi:MAG: alpha-ketoglutarate-dependent dioxygenase AlkB family protein [Roseibacillus sp.]